MDNSKETMSAFIGTPVTPTFYALVQAEADRMDEGNVARCTRRILREYFRKFELVDTPAAYRVGNEQ